MLVESLYDDLPLMPLEVYCCERLQLRVLARMVKDLTKIIAREILGSSTLVP